MQVPECAHGAYGYEYVRLRLDVRLRVRTAGNTYGWLALSATTAGSAYGWRRAQSAVRLASRTAGVRLASTVRLAARTAGVRLAYGWHCGLVAQLRSNVL